MRLDARGAFDEALEPARRAAYPPGEFVGQESFMRAHEILQLATKAGIGPGTSVLDLCCGVAGPGRFIAGELGCTSLGVDSSRDAVGLARHRAGSLPCRFEVARVPPVPSGAFDVVLLLETLLAFPDKHPLLAGISSALSTGGRFAFTAEVGQPLDDVDSSVMPDADTVWPIPFPDLLAGLQEVGLGVTWMSECTTAHREMADSLTRAFVAERSAITARLGRQALDELVEAHRLWSRWLGEGRVRKLALVAEKGTSHARSLSTTRPSSVRTSTDVMSSSTSKVPADSVIVRPAPDRQLPTRSAAPSRLRTTST